MSSGWDPAPGTHPYPPANTMVVSSFAQGCFDLRWDDPSTYAVGPTFNLPGNYQIVQATAYVQVLGAPLVEGTASGTVHVLSAPLPAGVTLTVGGLVLTGIHGARTPGASDFNANLATPTLLAQEIANALMDMNNPYRLLILSVANVGVVTLASVGSGSVGNSIMLSTNSVSLALSGSHLTGGQDGDTLTVGGQVLTAVSGVRTSGNNDFSSSADTFAVAQSIADALNDSANTLSAIVTAQADSGQVVLTAVPVGVLGNDVTLTTTSSVLTVSASKLSGGFGVENCMGESNATWTIVGVNIYRSDTGERGPYIRINNLPIGGLFYRDCTSNVLVTNELIPWNEFSWISRGDAANNRLYRFRTRYSPIVKRSGQAVPADSPLDVSVSINGVTVPVSAISGRAGEIDLINIAVYDPSTERNIPPVLPTSTSVVQVTYYRQGNLVRTDLDNISKIHYRVTTVALDPTGLSPSGYVETPLGYAPPVSPIHTEQIDYMWREAIRRNRWILEQGGERVKLFIRRVTGVPCRCQWQQSDPRLFEVSKQPVNNCHVCFPPGTLVRTEQGYRPIEQVQVGDRVLSSDGLYHRVTETMCNPFDGDLVSLLPNVSTRPILATPEHPLLVLRGRHHRNCGPKCDGYIAAGDGMTHAPPTVRLLPSGKWWARAQVHGSRGAGRKSLGTFDTKDQAEHAVQVFRQEHLRMGHVLEWDTAQNVLPKDWLVPQWNPDVQDLREVMMPPEFLRDPRFADIRLGNTHFPVDEDFLWMVGLYLAEGSSSGRTLNFALHVKETTYQERLVRLFTQYGYHPKVRHTKGNGCVVLVNSTSLAQWFPVWLGRGCANKHIPEEFMSLPEPKIRALVQGIYDGDGSKRENEITQTSEILALQLVDLLHRMGEQPLVRQFHQRALTPKGNTRKLAFAVSWAEETLQRTNRKGRWAFQGKILSQVRSVAGVPYTGSVYNLEVEGDHTYIVQGVVVHNCYGTGYYGGFEGPIDIILAPDDAERAVRQTVQGRRLEHTYEVWTGPTPLLSQRDFIVKQNGERYSIGPVRRTQVRGVVLQQAFNIQYLDECDIRYSVPLGNLYELPWPETRYTNPEDSACVESEPYPVGFDYQAAPMATEVPKIPDGREQRGRTPIWANLTYGGKGGS